MDNYNSILLVVTSGLLTVSIFFVKRLINSIDVLTKTVQSLRDSKIKQEDAIKQLKEDTKIQSLRISNLKKLFTEIDKKIYKIENACQIHHG